MLSTGDEDTGVLRLKNPEYTQLETACVVLSVLTRNRTSVPYGCYDIVKEELINGRGALQKPPFAEFLAE